MLRTMPEATGCWEVEGSPERALQVWRLLTIHTLSGKQSPDMNLTASNPSLSMAAFLSRPNTIGIHPDGQGDAGCYNSPFKDSDWFRKDDDVRFSSLSASNGERAGVRCRNDGPPKGNANFAWVQQFIHHLAPHGMAGLNAVRKDLANGSMSSNQSGEGDIRRALVEADLVDCMVALPGQLFYSTQTTVCLKLLAKIKIADA